jgi:heme-degrading monooxygenase HmoA
MILERAEILARPGSEIALAEALDGPGMAILSSARGSHSVRIGRSLESPDKFILLIEWDSVEAHKAFKGPSGQSPFGQLITPLVAGGNMEFFDLGFMP